MSEAPAPPDHGAEQRLQAQIDALRAELTREVRTRRVVVVDTAGRERAVLSADPGVGSVRLDDHEGRASVELYAVDAIDADGPEVGLALVVDGEVVRWVSELVNHGSGR